MYILVYSNTPASTLDTFLECEVLVKTALNRVAITTYCTGFLLDTWKSKYCTLEQ